MPPKLHRSHLSIWWKFPSQSLGIGATNRLKLKKSRLWFSSTKSCSAETQAIKAFPLESLLYIVATLCQYYTFQAGLGNQELFHMFYGKMHSEFQIFSINSLYRLHPSVHILGFRSISYNVIILNNLIFYLFLLFWKWVPAKFYI